MGWRDYIIVYYFRQFKTKQTNKMAKEKYTIAELREDKKHVEKLVTTLLMELESKYDINVTYTTFGSEEGGILSRIGKKPSKNNKFTIDVEVN